MRTLEGEGTGAATSRAAAPTLSDNPTSRLWPVPTPHATASCRPASRCSTRKASRPCRPTRFAAELGISPGNLHYHFKAKQLIVEWLFRRFEQRLEALNGSSASIAAIDDLWLALHLRFEAIDEYRFIYRDMAFLASEYPALGQRARGPHRAEPAGRADAVRRPGGLGRDRDQCGAGAHPCAADGLHHHLLAVVRAARAGRDALAQADPGLAAFYTLTLVSPYVSSESRAYLDYLRGKYLG